MNKVILTGRLTRDPEIKVSQRGDGESLKIARFTLAVDRRVKTGDQNADYISCVSFGKLAEFNEKYCKQGTKLVISGRIQTGSYTNKEGQKVYTTEVVIEEQEFAESKASSMKSGSQGTSPTTASVLVSNDGYIDIPEGIENDLPFK